MWRKQNTEDKCGVVKNCKIRREKEVNGLEGERLWAMEVKGARKKSKAMSTLNLLHSTVPMLQLQPTLTTRVLPSL